MNIPRGLFALLLLTTAITKLLDMPGFYAVVDSYRLLPRALIPVSAWALALFELLLAAWLIRGRRLEQAALALIALHALYLVWISSALARGLHLDNCGCFGVYFARPLRWYTPFEDIVLIALAVWLWIASRSAPGNPA